MRNILLPLDLYKDVPRVLRQALAFLRETEGPLHIFLLKTYTVPVSLSEEVIDTHDELQGRLLKELQEELKTAKGLAADGKMSFETVLQMGRPANVISRVVKERNIDFVILGPADNSFRREDALNLLSRIRCPVVMLPSQTVP